MRTRSVCGFFLTWVGSYVLESMRTLSYTRTLGEKEREKEEEEGASHVALLKLGCLQHLLQHSGGVDEIERNIFRHLVCCTQLYHAEGRRTLWTSRRSSLPLATPAHKVPTAGQIEAFTVYRIRLAPASTTQYSPLHWQSDAPRYREIGTLTVGIVVKANLGDTDHPHFADPDCRLAQLRSRFKVQGSRFIDKALQNARMRTRALSKFVCAAC